jgi:flagellar protein FliO/FliZ
LPSIPAIENLSSATKYVIAFAIIFILLALFALILRRLTGGRTALSNERGRGRQPRLGIVDVYDLDRQRQLILLRRDNVEHLLLVGGPNDVVVETNIVRVAGARLPPATTDALDRMDSERNGEISSLRPSIDMPPARSEIPIAAHLGSLETAVAGAALEQVTAAPARAPEPVLKPTEVTPRPQPAPERNVRLPNGDAPEVRPAPRPATPPVGRANLPAQAPAGANGSGGPESAGNRAVLSDMARQLEDALKRPAAPAEGGERQMPLPNRPSEPQRNAAARALLETPRVSPVAPPPPRPAPVEPRVQTPRPQDSVPAPQPAAPPEPREAPEPRPEPARIAEPAPTAAAPVPLPRPAAPSAPPPQPEPARAAVTPPPRPAPAPPPAPAPKPEPAAGRDPFSIEDIEAEFARLLGRPLDKK